MALSPVELPLDLNVWAPVADRHTLMRRRGKSELRERGGLRKARERRLEVFL
jgi:hypothetical protein